MNVSEEYIGIKLATKVVLSIIRKKKFEKSLSKLRKLYPEYELYDKEIISLSKKAGHQLVKSINDKNPKGIVETINEYTTKIKEFIKRSIPKLTRKKEIKSVLLLVGLCGWVNSSMKAIIMSIEQIWPFDKVSLAILSSLFTGAVTEELVRSASLELGIGGKFTIVVNMVEFPMYVGSMIYKGVPFKKAIKARLLAIGAHTLFYIVQKTFQKVGKPNLGLFIAILLHYAWNVCSDLNLIVE